MFAVPAVTPVITPEEIPAVATDVFELDHVPPDGALASVVVAPGHTVAVPVIEDGKAFTVTTVEVMQPVEVSI
jgi:hypothetical protein